MLKGKLESTNHVHFVISQETYRQDQGHINYGCEKQRNWKPINQYNNQVKKTKKIPEHLAWLLSEVTNQAEKTHGLEKGAVDITLGTTTNQ